MMIAVLHLAKEFRNTQRVKTEDHGEHCRHTRKEAYYRTEREHA
jgi:hypothetical protein